MPDRDTTRINERIRVPEVRVIDENGEQVGILPTDKALRMAQDRDLDLVEVAPNSKPPVCRILDYSKYKYEQAQKQKAARKHQTTIVLREIKFRPKIAEHDYATKKGHVERFLLHKDKVKVTIMFRGREVTHPERGEMILNRLAEELELIAQVDQRPQQDGRNMTMLLSPSKAVIAGQIDAEAWKNRATEPVDGEGDELEGITVDGPGEEPSAPRVAPKPAEKPARASKPKAEPAPEAEPEVEAPSPSRSPQLRSRRPSQRPLRRRPPQSPSRSRLRPPLPRRSPSPSQRQSRRRPALRPSPRLRPHASARQAEAESRHRRRVSAREEERGRGRG